MVESSHVDADTARECSRRRAIVLGLSGGRWLPRAHGVTGEPHSGYKLRRDRITHKRVGYTVGRARGTRPKALLALIATLGGVSRGSGEHQGSR